MAPFGRRCVLAFVIAWAASTPLASPASQQSAAGTLGYIAEQFYAETWKLNPINATNVGIHTYDGQLGSYGSGDYGGRIAHLRATLVALGLIPDASLSLDDRADKTILQNLIKEQLWDLQTRKAWTKDPRTYTGIAADGIYGIMERSYAPLGQRLRYVISREKQIPRLIAQAEANLAPSRVDLTTARLALLDTAGAVDFFTNDVPLAFAGVTDPTLQAQFKASNAAAIATLKSYQRFIKTSIVPKASGSYAIGADAYQYLEDLQNVQHIPLAELESIGEAALRRDKAAFAATAAEINPNLPPQTVFAGVRQDHPAPGQLLSTAQRLLNDLVAFIKAKGIIDLPNAPIAKVIATPKFQAQTSFASMDSPGPLETKATEAYYRVTLVDPSWSAKQAQEHLGFFNKYSLAVVSLHEAYPGHYTNYLFNKRANLSLIRKLNWNVAFGEGWAHYDEQMMVDQGLGNGDPRMRLAQLSLALQRECRYLVGIREHTQGMTVAEATAFFKTNAFMGTQPAYREALRGTQDPLYGYYTLGKLMLLKLRADDRARLGSKFSLRTFHDQVLSHGDPPIYFLRKMILGSDDTGSLL